MSLVTPIIQRWIDEGRRDPDALWARAADDLNWFRPKTRSGKLMRRVLKAVILDRDPGDITTIEDEGSVEETRQAWLHMKLEMKTDG
jgi:hypothetical protein